MWRGLGEAREQAGTIAAVDANEGAHKGGHLRVGSIQEKALAAGSGLLAVLLLHSRLDRVLLAPVVDHQPYGLVRVDHRLVSVQSRALLLDLDNLFVAVACTKQNKS